MSAAYMYKWSVLNNFIKDYEEDLPSEEISYWEKTFRERVKIHIIGILYGISSAESIADLYELGKMHQTWHNPFMNKLFFSALNDLRGKFEDAYIDMLMEIFAEAAYIAQDDRNHSEADFVKMMEDGFEDIFPELSFVKREAVFENVRLDLLAEEPYSRRAVIFEAKLGSKDPTNQLLAYRNLFDNPFLVGITENRLPDRIKQSGIYYFTYQELNTRAVYNIQKTFSKGRKSFKYLPQKFDLDLKKLADIDGDKNMFLSRI